MFYDYAKIDKQGCLKTCPSNDLSGKITGRRVVNLHAWFDENPQQRKALGWLKYIRHDERDVEFDSQTQFIVSSIKIVDEYTIEDVLHVLQKSEQMLMQEEVYVYKSVFADMLEVYDD